MEELGLGDDDGDLEMLAERDEEGDAERDGERDDETDEEGDREIEAEGLPAAAMYVTAIALHFVAPPIVPVALTAVVAATILYSTDVWVLIVGVVTSE